MKTKLSFLLLMFLTLGKVECAVNVSNVAERNFYCGVNDSLFFSTMFLSLVDVFNDFDNVYSLPDKATCFKHAAYCSAPVCIEGIMHVCIKPDHAQYGIAQKLMCCLYVANIVRIGYKFCKVQKSNSAQENEIRRLRNENSKLDAEIAQQQNIRLQSAEPIVIFRNSNEAP